MKKFLNTFNKAFLIFIAFFVPLFSFAHVKWFAQAENYVEPYKLSMPFVLFGIFIAIIVILLGVYLEKKIKIPESLNVLIEKLAPSVLSVASIGFGLAFIIFSIKGFIFSPNLHAIGTLGTVMLSIQLIAGCMILLGIYERFAGFMLITLFSLGFYAYGIEMIDTLEMLGFAFYIMIVGRPKWKIIETNVLNNFTHHIHNYGYPILRVGTGLNLIVLGFTEKILTPSLTQNFLQSHSWNFMQTLGFVNFTDYKFAFYAGLFEILFGVFFLLGLITRITTIFLAIFLVTTLYLLGPLELIGHLPHFSIAIVLLVLGSGAKLILERK